TAYAITRAVFENFDDFRKMAPALARLTRQDAVTGAVVPLHPGAVKYFKEAGLM
ncbi:MAG: TAXI family TRAP transporter solute-binding subunit, partial [Betaproteobacteria bacterium]